MKKKFIFSPFGDTGKIKITHESDSIENACLFFFKFFYGHDYFWHYNYEFKLIKSRVKEL